MSDATAGFGFPAGPPGRTLTGWAMTYAIAGLLGSLISIAVLSYYDPIRWPIVLLPRLALFLPAMAPLALVHALHLRRHIGLGAALAAPAAGLGGAAALIALCAFHLSMVVNWYQPAWVRVLPESLRYIAAIPGLLAVVGGAWFGLVEWTALRRAARPGGWAALLLPASVICAFAVLVPHYFAGRHGRDMGWVAAALLSLPLTGAAIGALTQFVLATASGPVPRRRPDRSLGRVIGKRLFARWVGWHLVTALIGGLATMFLAFPVFEQFENEMARSNAQMAIHPSVLLPLAATPIAVYQSWALREATQSLVWFSLVVLVVLPPCPYLLLFSFSFASVFTGPQGGLVYALACPALIGFIWAGGVLAIPMLAVTSFWRWMLQGGSALGIGAVAVYFGWGFATNIGWWTWPAGILAASLVFALFTYRAVRPALALADPPAPAALPSPASP
jgi:hypothetical protein